MGNISACCIGNGDSVDQNPAAITGQNMMIHFSGSVNSNPDIMTILGGSIGFKPLSFIAMGFSLNGVNYGIMTGNITYDGDEGQRIQTGDTAIRTVVGFAKQGLFSKTVNIHVGISEKYSASRLDEVLLSCYATDAGIIITLNNLLPGGSGRRIFKTPVAPNTIYTGLLLRNFFFSVNGNSMNIGNNEKYAQFKAIPGIGYSYSIRKLISTKIFFDFEVIDKIAHIGSEIGFVDFFYLRGGTEISAENEKFTFGLGLCKTIGLGLELALNYTIVPSDFVGTVQTVGISIGLEQPRQLR